MTEDKKRQHRLYVTFRENKDEIELYNWIVEQSRIAGVAAYFKLLAQKDKDLKEGKK